MKHILVLIALISMASVVYAGEPMEYVYAVHSDGSITDLMIYTAKNEQTLIHAMPDCTIKRTIKDSDTWAMLFSDHKPLKYDKNDVVIDQAKVDAATLTQSVAIKIDAKQKIQAIDALLLTATDAKEIAELQKQKAELLTKL